MTAAADLMQELVFGQPDPQNLSMVKRVAEERLPNELVRRWQSAVDHDLADNPFTEPELVKLTQQRGEQSVREVAKTPRLAYGATVLGVLVTQDFLLFLQLGDGDILAVAEDGTVTRPFARDARLIANETTSLCMSEAWREVRLRFQANYGGLPALIMAATDGYANSFVNDHAFRKVGSDILAIMREDGVGSVEESLAEWLDGASAAGSGDDISLGILYRVDAVRAQSGPAPSSEYTSSDDASSDDALAEGASVLPDAEASTLAGKRAVVSPLSAVTGVAPVSPGEAHTPSEGAHVPDAQPVERRARGSATEDSELRSRFVARIKHEGPSEPSKRVRLADVVGCDDDDVDGAASTDTAAQPARRD